MQANSKPIDALPEDPAILQELLLSAWSERDRVVAERNELAEQNERLQHLVLKLIRLKFGAKSERLPDVQNRSSNSAASFFSSCAGPSPQTGTCSATMLATT